MNPLQSESVVELLNADSSSSEEKIEGLDEVINQGWDEYPIDSVFIRSDSRPVKYVVDRILNDRYVMHPDFQRDFVWTKQKQSKLIESCLMRIPLPVFYVAESDDGRIIVVDGLQRLTTFKRYIQNELKLTFHSRDVSPRKHWLEGKKFSDLPINLQERIEDTQLILYILDYKVPQRVKLDIFERVNSGAPLSRQQMRNAIFCGTATNWLKIMADGSAFQSATGNSLSKKSMRDREAVNRFVSFKLCGWQEYKGDMDEFLAEGIRRLNFYSKIDLDILKMLFENTMILCFDIFGEHCFRKSLMVESSKKSMINISLFDVMSVVFSKNFDRIKMYSKSSIKNKVINILYDPVFIDSITIATNSTKAVQYRYQQFEREFGPNVQGEFVSQD